MNNDKGNGFGNGFLFGIIVGVAIALLFTTKKGRAILSELLEHGENALEDFVEPDEDLSSEPFSEEDEPENTGMVMEEKPRTNGHRRLFKGIKKR